MDVFIEQFISKRTEAHQRKVKSEKLVELIQSGSLIKGGNITVPSSVNNQSGAVPYQAPYPTSWKLPYTAGMANMPTAGSYLPR